MAKEPNVKAVADAAKKALDDYKGSDPLLRAVLVAQAAQIELLERKVEWLGHKELARTDNAPYWSGPHARQIT